MVRGVVKFVSAAGIAFAIAYPIIQERSARSAIQHTMINSLNANDTAALQQWQGSAESFVAMLYDRCMRANNGDTAACVRYQQ